MSYNQEVFTVHLHRNFKRKRYKIMKKKTVVGSSTRHSKVDFIFHNPVPLIEGFCFVILSFLFVLNVVFALLVNEVGMYVTDRVPYLT